MSGASVTVDDKAVVEALRDLQRRVGDPSPALNAIGQLLVTETDLAFRGERDPWGRSWSALSPVTAKKRRGSTSQILSDTGRLRNSVNARVQGDSVTVGTNVEYAAPQQFGAKKGAFGSTRRGAPIPWGDIPARPFLPTRDGRVDLPEGTRLDILALIAKALDVAS